MSIASVHNNLNAYLYNLLKPDLQKIQTEVLSEISQLQVAKVPIQKPVYGTKEIIDEYVPSIKPKVEVTLEERMNQVISPEEIKNLLSILMKVAPVPASLGQFVDIKG